MKYLNDTKTELLELLFTGTNPAQLARTLGISTSCLRGRINQLNKDLRLPWYFERKHYVKYEQQVRSIVKLWDAYVITELAHRQQIQDIVNKFKEYKA